MKDKCNIVADMIPLYIEGMLSKDSKLFIEEHVKECEECRKIIDKYDETIKSDLEIRKEKNINQIVPLKKTKKKIKNKIILSVSIIGIAAIVLGFLAGRHEKQLIYVEEGTNTLKKYESDYFTDEEKDILNHKPSEYEKQIANNVINDAKVAFEDCGKYSCDECDKIYGCLAQYAIDREQADSFKLVGKQYLLTNLGCNISESEGYIWINYTIIGYKEGYVSETGSFDVNSLWKIEKGEDGNWKVIEVKEHP